MQNDKLLIGLRTCSVIAGSWLFLSAFCWPHSRVQFNVAWIIGMIVVNLAILALDKRRWADVLQIASGLALIASPLAWSEDTLTRRNNLWVGLALVAFGLLASLL